MKGSILSGSAAFGYVVIGIIAFLLGAVVTLMCFKAKNLQKPPERDKEKYI